MKKFSKATLQYKETDYEYRSYVLEGVKPSKKGFELRFDRSACFFCPRVDNFIPKRGMFVKLYGKGMGYVVRGLEIENKIIFYRTPEQEKKHFELYLKRSDEKSKKQYEKIKPKLEEDYNSLPDVFKRRLDRLRKTEKSDRHTWEPYELFIYKQAAEMIKYITTVDALELFKKSTWEIQKQIVPTLDSGHSGNTFSCAIGLAKAYLLGKEI